MHEVRIYLDKDKEEELEMLIPSDEMKKVNEPYLGSDFIPVCDFCGKHDDMFSFFPELGHQVMCQKCAKEHKKMVHWYTEDLHPVFNSLISFMKNYNLGWTQKDYMKVDEFFSSKGHLSLHIEKFMED